MVSMAAMIACRWGELMVKISASRGTSQPRKARLSFFLWSTVFCLFGISGTAFAEHGGPAPILGFPMGTMRVIDTGPTTTVFWHPVNPIPFENMSSPSTQSIIASQGYLNFSVENGVLQVHKVEVTEAFRRKGISGLLYQEMDRCLPAEVTSAQSKWVDVNSKVFRDLGASAADPPDVLVALGRQVPSSKTMAEIGFELTAVEFRKGQIHVVHTKRGPKVFKAKCGALSVAWAVCATAAVCLDSSGEVAPWIDTINNVIDVVDVTGWWLSIPMYVIGKNYEQEERNKDLVTSYFIGKTPASMNSREQSVFFNPYVSWTLSSRGVPNPYEVQSPVSVFSPPQQPPPPRENVDFYRAWQFFGN